MPRKSYQSKKFVGFFPSRGQRSQTVINRIAKQRKLNPKNLEAYAKPGIGWEIWKK